VASLYSTKVRASGGRHGSIRSGDGLLDLKLALPRALGGRGDATNPEQLFAGGYAACFENALLHGQGRILSSAGACCSHLKRLGNGSVRRRRSETIELRG
jgi:Ohr subfamily peroxiredoxin